AHGELDRLETMVALRGLEPLEAHLGRALEALDLGPPLPLVGPHTRPGPPAKFRQRYRFLRIGCPLSSSAKSASVNATVSSSDASSSPARRQVASVVSRMKVASCAS